MKTFKSFFEKKTHVNAINMCSKCSTTIDDFTESSNTYNFAFDSDKNNNVLNNTYENTELIKIECNINNNISKYKFNILENTNNKQNNLFIKNIISCQYITYLNKYIILYQSLITPLFNIDHIINLIYNESYHDLIYRHFKNKIINYGYKQCTINNTEVKLLYELINEQCMYEIITFNEQLLVSIPIDFKQNMDMTNISEIKIDELKTNIFIQLNEFKKQIIFNKLNDESDKENKDNIKNYKKEELNNDFLNYLLCESTKKNLKYNNFLNPLFIYKIKQLIYNKSNEIILTKYNKQHVLYHFITTVYDKTNNYIIDKIGYSCDIIKRMSSLESEYKCKFFLINIKIINSEQDEKEFHNIIKKNHKELLYPIKINNKEKTELYIHDEILVKCFNEFKESLNVNNDITNNTEEDLQLIDTMNNIKYQMDIFNSFINDKIDFTKQFDTIINIVNANNKMKHEIKIKELNIKELELENINYNLKNKK
jgi:hypothetical protein